MSGMGSTTTASDIEGAINPTTNVLVVLGSIVGVISGLLSIVIICIILFQHRRRHQQQDRLLLGMIGHNFLFSLINAVPFDYNASAGVTNGDYCWWRGWWFGTSYGIVLYVWFMLVATIYVLLFETTLPVKAEVFGHVIFNIGAILALVLFMVPCYDDYQGELNSGNDDNGAGDSITQTILFPEMRGQLVLVVVAIVLWGIVWWNSRGLEARWQNMMTALDMVEDQSVKEDEMDQVLLSYGQHSRELRYYPVIFLLFGIPALTFFTDDCYSEDNCRHAVEFVLVLRSLAIIAWFLIIKTNREDFLRFPAICRQFWDDMMGRRRQEDPDNMVADRRYSRNSSLVSTSSRGGKTRSFASRQTRSFASRQSSMTDMNQRLLDGDSELAAAGNNLSLLGANDGVANRGARDGHTEYDSDDAGAAGGVGAGIQYDLFQDDNNLLRCESMMLPRNPSFVERRVHPASMRVTSSAAAAAIAAAKGMSRKSKSAWPSPNAASMQPHTLPSETMSTTGPAADPQYAEIDDVSAEEYFPPEDPGIRSPGAVTTSAW